MKKLTKKTITCLLTLFSLSTAMTACNSRSAQPFTPAGHQYQSNVKRNIQSYNTDEIIQQSWKAYEELKDFTGMVAIWDSKTGNPKDVDYGESNFFFKGPRKEKVEVTKSSDSKKVGSLIVYTGGSKVEVLLAKPIPFLGRRFSLDAGDKKIATSRGLPFPELDMYSMLRRISREGVKTSHLGAGNVNGRKTFVIEALGSFKGLDKDITRELVNIDQETLLPIQDEAFVNDKTVLKINISNIKVNTGLKDDTFVLPSSMMVAGR